MILACLAALAFVGCTQDIEVVAHRSQELSASRPLAAFTCRIDGAPRAIRCEPASNLPASARPLDDPLPGGPRHFKLLTTRAHYDSTSEVLHADVAVQSDLGEPIGTLDGAVISGIRVSFGSSPTLRNGDASGCITNRDGVGVPDDPNAPYISYPQILSPRRASDSRTWKLSLNAKCACLNVYVWAAFPAEQSVPANPPRTVPAWIYADSNVAGPTSVIGGRFLKRVVVVEFRDAAPQEDKQFAIAVAGANVIGGDRAPDGSGAYYVTVPDDGSGAGLVAAVKLLQALSVVRAAYLKAALSTG